jgi:hypothetical protein
MEPVRLPKVIAPVTHADRVKRAKPREDTGGDAGFGRYLHQDQGRSADGSAVAPENALPSEDPVSPEASTDAGGQPGKKLIDIHV